LVALLGRIMDIIAVRNDATEFVRENYTFKSAMWCCDEMCKRWIHEHVGFGFFKTWTVQEQAIVTFGGFEITCCPWCGEKINITIEERT